MKLILAILILTLSGCITPFSTWRNPLPYDFDYNSLPKQGEPINQWHLKSDTDLQNSSN